jgi:nucleoside-diphosphate-sugar epimerase
MKILITGSTGFIGKHIVHYLLTHTENELILVYRSELRKKIENSRVSYIQLDINQLPDNCFDFMGQPDLLIHLAWDDLLNYKNLSHLDTILPAHMKFLSAMAQQGLKKITVAGTCFEYGLQAGACSETDRAMPLLPYAIAKDVLRQYLEKLSEKYLVQWTWLRYFYMIGEGQSPKTLIGLLKSAIESDQPVFKMSGGEQLRDYLSVEEIAAYTCQLSMQKHSGGIVNIGSGIPVSIRNLVERYIEENYPQANIQLELGYFPYPDYEPMAFWANTGKLQTLIQH